METRKISLLICFVSVIIQSSSHVAAIKISIGPNIRVGPEKTCQAEPFIAAHPVDSQNLIISASEVVDGLKGQGMLSRSYVSDDAGQTWEATELPGQLDAVVNGRLHTELEGKNCVFHRIAKLPPNLCHRLAPVSQAWSQCAAASLSSKARELRKIDRLICDRQMCGGF